MEVVGAPLRRQVAAEGFAIVPSVFGIGEITEILKAVPDLGAKAGTRTLLETEVGKQLAADPRLAGLAEEVLRAVVRPIRGIIFDKSPKANWTLGWHQDTKIALRERGETTGFRNWSEKEGVAHCQPPVELLEQCVAVRLHLDDCGVENGPLRVIPRSHLAGYWDEVSPQPWEDEVVCSCQAGDVVMMKPLLLHASSPASVPSHRRVAHIEFCSAELPEGLRWAYG